jgi:hypothetical protein
MVATHRRKTWRRVLVYSNAKANRATVRRYFEEWRREQGLIARCDNAACPFHSEPLVWNGRPLPLVLDHKDGNTRDNRPEILQYLCPNCEAQLPTRGGSNRGRTRRLDDNGFLIIERDGRKSYTHLGSIGVEHRISAQASFHRAVRHNDDVDASK